MKKRKKSKIPYFIAIIALILAAFIIKVYFFSTPEKPNYITAIVGRGDIEQTVLADGTVEAFKLVNVGAQVSGQIKVLHVSLGDPVKKGQLIAEIDDLTQQNNLKETEATLKNLDAQRAAKIAIGKNNQIDFKRQQTLLQQQAGSQADYDSAVATLEVNQAEIKSYDAQIEKAQIALSTAKLNLGYTKIHSPIDGVVVTTPVEEGQTVNAVQSAPTIVQVAQLDTVTVKAQISEADVINVKAGMPLYFTILGAPESRYHAELRKVEPAPYDYSSSSVSSTANAVFYNGLFDVPNNDGKLRVSMTAQVYLILAQSKDVITVSSSALKPGKKANEYTVRVVDNNGLESEREVTIGINNNVIAEVISGLQSGEKVVIGSTSAKMTGSGTSTSSGMRMRI